MHIITTKEFRANQKKYFDLVANRNQVIIRRGSNQAFALVMTTDDDLTISEEFAQKIAKAREDYKLGKGTLCKTFEESKAFLESL